MGCSPSRGGTTPPETLFAQRINPWTPAAELGRSALTGIVRRGKRLLSAQMLEDGTARVYGQGRGDQVYRRLNQPCRRCGTPITARPIGPALTERTLFFCPGCQPSST